MTDQTISGDLSVTGSVQIQNDSNFQSNLHIKKNLQIDGSSYTFGRLDVVGPLKVEESIEVTKDAQFSGSVGIGSSNTSKHPLKIQGAGHGEELIGFESPAGAVKWHINQKLGGKLQGLNFVESGVKDGRLFLKAGGNVGIGTTEPRKPIHLKSEQSNPIIIQNGWASTKEASRLLDSLPNRSFIIGGPWRDLLFFYWKDESNNKYVGTVPGKPL